VEKRLERLFRIRHTVVTAGASALAFTLSGLLEHIDIEPLSLIKIVAGVAGGVIGHLIDRPGAGEREIGGWQ